MKKQHDPNHPPRLPNELEALADQPPMGEPVRIGGLMPEVLDQYQLKALPTLYHGIQYRSRLEAR